jgi:hypothetical protein
MEAATILTRGALSIRAVGNYLKRWGFTPQKPIKRAYEQQPEAVKAWLHEQYPAIEARAKADGGEVHWGATRPRWRLKVFECLINRTDRRRRKKLKAIGGAKRSTDLSGVSA